MDLQELWKLKGDFNDNMDKLVNLIEYYQWLEESTKAIKEKAQAREKFYKNSQERLKQAISFFMHQAWKDKLETAKARLSFRESTKVLITNEDIVPEEFFKIEQVKKVDKTAVKDFLKNDWYCEWAYLDKNKNLQIK